MHPAAASADDDMQRARAESIAVRAELEARIETSSRERGGALAAGTRG